MSTAETLVKDAQELLDNEVLIPIIVEKCASRGYAPSDENELVALLKVASEIRTGILNGEIAPIPAAELNENGEFSKEASEKISSDMLAYADDITVNFNEVDERVKEAAACVAWGTLEELSAAGADA